LKRLHGGEKTLSYDLVIRNGLLGTEKSVTRGDIGIREGRIAAIGDDVGRGYREIDATGRLVLPGGVDTHCHIEQMSAAGMMTADDFESATAAAAFGGTTTVISFAAQHRGMDITEVVADYAARAACGAMVDYTFHMIVADPNAETMARLPDLVAAGHSSIKLFMTYDRLLVDDEKILDVMSLARNCGAAICVHAENHGIIAWASQNLLKAGKIAPRYQPMSHPRQSEAEAIYRLIALSEVADCPVTIFHISTAEGAAIIRDARRRGVRVAAETCPQYLLLTAEHLDRPGFEGAKWCCSPPLRSAADQEALWEALRHRDLQMVSSDHAPYAWDESGKLKNGLDANFTQIVNGLPGIETRQLLMFDAMVSQGNLSVPDFVDLTSTTPARHYGLYPRKGALIVGADADVVLWNLDRRTTITASTLHDRTGYTPYEGKEVRGLPETVLCRGNVIIAEGNLLAKPGDGKFLPRVSRFRQSADVVEAG
jgi:dihydropyrimidinase